MTEAPRRGSLFVIFLTVFIDLLGFGMVIPLLPIYAKLLPSMQAMTPAQQGLTIGLLMSSFSAMQFLFAPLWGRLSDRIGRRPVLMVGLAGSVVFYTLFGLATEWASLWGLFIARIGAGIAGATISTTQAYIADSTTLEGRSKGMALIGAAFGLGFAIGPVFGVISLLLSGDESLSPWPGYFAAGLSFVALMLAVFKLPESLRPDTSTARSKLFDLQALSDAVSMPSVALLILAAFVSLLAFASFESTLSLLLQYKADAAAHMQDRGAHRLPANLLLVFSYIGLVLCFAQGVLVRRLAGKISDERLAMIGSTVAILGFALLALASYQVNIPSLLGALTVAIVGFSMITPSLNALISRRSDPARQGGILGLNQSAGALARIIGPVTGNYLLARHHTWPYWAATALMIAGAMLVALAVRAGKDFGNGQSH
jgi:DHA1 family tetracycline resistance protein-like MFS transporter